MYHPQLPHNDLIRLPGSFDYQNSDILSLAIQANQALAKLDGLSLLLPNPEVIMTLLMTKESIASNGIENINTTTMQFLQQEALGIANLSGADKEVAHYRSILLYGIDALQTQGGISTNLLIDLQSQIQSTKPGIRTIPGTVIANTAGEVLYTPPEGKSEILSLLSNLEQFVHANDGIDPLIKVGVIHYQFESIHPFYDGNGRIGRILMILYLILTEKMSSAVLFLSGYIYTHKDGYYKALQATHGSDNYTPIIVYILDAIIQQSYKTQDLILAIHHSMQDTIVRLESSDIRQYHTVAQTLFEHPFCPISLLTDKTGLTRQTISDYVKKLEFADIVHTVKLGNHKLVYVPKFVDCLK